MSKLTQVEGQAMSILSPDQKTSLESDDGNDAVQRLSEESIELARRARRTIKDYVPGINSTVGDDAYGVRAWFAGVWASYAATLNNDDERAAALASLAGLFEGPAKWRSTFESLVTQYEGAFGTAALRQAAAEAIVACHPAHDVDEVKGALIAIGKGLLAVSEMTALNVVGDLADVYADFDAILGG